MRLKELAINHYGPLRDIRLQFEPGLQVFYGPNESGKTLLIEAALRLLLGKNLKDFQGIQRVPDLPQGRISFVHLGQEHIFDGKLLLENVTGLSGRDLRNIFVIRNKDLQLREQATYFGQLTDQLLGMESQRLTKLKETLRNFGRLTRAASDAPLSKSQDFDWIGEKVASAEKLAADIKEYLADAEKQKLDFLEQTMECQRRRLLAVNKELQLQETAAAWSKYADLGRRVEEHALYYKTVQALGSYSQEKFIELKDLESRSKGNKETVARCQEQLAQLKPLIKEAEADFQAASIAYNSMEGKKELLEQISLQAQTTAESDPAPNNAYWGRFGFALIGVTAIGLLLAAKDVLPGPLLSLPYWALGGALLILAIEGVLRRRNHNSRKMHLRLLQQGAAVGLAATTLQELAAAVSTEKTAVLQARERQQINNQTLHRLTDKAQFLEQSIQNANTEAARLDQEIEKQLGRLAIAALAQFEEQMELYRQAQNRCQDADQYLQSAFGQAPEPGDSWQTLYQELSVPPNPDIPWDESHCSELRREKDELSQAIEKLQGSLNSHQAELARFAAACQGLPLAKELGAKLPAQFPDLEMLAYGLTLVEQFIKAVVETRALATGLIALVERVETEQKSKITDLVGPNKPLQRLFSTISAGNYNAVKLDDELGIHVVNREGIELPASALSQGTYDQLYLALRLSLAKDLLESEPGFFLMDDAFLCADSDRLGTILRLLAELAETGWQILFFTMDERVLNSSYTASAVTYLKPL